MKLPILLMLSLSSLALPAQTTASGSLSPQVIAGPFDWTRELETISQVPFTTTGGGFHADVLPMHAWNKKPTVYTLRTLGPAIVSKITAKHYAITGHLKYSDVAPGSFLELENWFAPEQPGGPEGFYFSRTLGDAGAMAKIEGSDDGRDFILPFDSTGTKTSLSRLVLKLHAMGPGEFEISNVKLVQYPDSTGAGALSSSTVTSSSHQVIDGISFLLGITASVLFLAVIGASRFLLRRLRSRAKDRELRRIASLDG